MVGQNSAAVPAPTSELVVRGLRSEFVSERRLRVWGSASAPPGAEIRVRVRLASTRIDVPRPIPVGSDGLFEGVVEVPAHDHRDARVQVVLVPRR